MINTEECDHYWVPGDMRSDWICCHCGARADIPEPIESKEIRQ